MSQRVISPAVYTFVLIVLLALTALTMAVSFLPLEGSWHTAAGLGIAVVKASLVVLFFMHALHSPRTTWLVIAVAITWMTILFGLTFCDYVSRDWIPYAPGH